METVLIVIHLMVVLALVAVVLLQRSEGGALGIGGGGFMSARGAANALTRTTAILAAAFFATSIGLGVLAKVNKGPGGIIEQIEQQQPAGSGGVLDQLGGAPSQTQSAPSVPAAPEQPAQQQAPATGTAAPAAPATPQVPSGQ
jgi:preprotein translocase subunit SecG